MLAKSDQFVAALYASTLAAGTFISVTLVGIAPVLPSVGGVVALIVIEVSLLQSMNTPLPMLVTLAGIEIEVNSLQKKNALLPMLVTVDGIVIVVNVDNSLNALAPMLVTLPSVGITVFLHPASKVFDAVSMMALPAL